MYFYVVLGKRGGLDVSVVNLSKAQQASAGLKPETHKVSHQLKDNLRDCESLLVIEADFGGGFILVRQNNFHLCVTDQPSRSSMTSFSKGRSRKRRWTTRTGFLRR